MIKFNPKQKSMIELNIATLIFASGPLFVKLISVSAAAITFWRSAIAFLGFIAVLYFFKISIKPKSKKDFFSLILSGIFTAIHWFTFYYAIKISSVSIGVVAVFTFPLFTALMEPFFFNEKIDKTNVLLAALAIIGVYTMIPTLSLSNHITKGILFGLTSAFFGALRGILSRKLIYTYSSCTVVFYQISTTALLYSPILFISPQLPSLADLGYLIYLGIVLTTIAHSLFINAMKTLTAQVVGIISCWQMIITPTLAFFILKEVPEPTTILGGSIIFIAVIIEVIKVQMLSKTQK